MHPPDQSFTLPPPNLQGSTWAVRRRNYHTHDPHPPSLAARVTPADVPYLRPARCYALWSDKQQVRAALRLRRGEIDQRAAE